MSSYEDRIRAVELYIKLGKRIRATFVSWVLLLERVDQRLQPHAACAHPARQVPAD